MLALDAVHVAARGFHVDARLRRDLRDLLERHARLGELLFVYADLFVQLLLARLETVDFRDGRRLARQQLVVAG